MAKQSGPHYWTCGYCSSEHSAYTYYDKTDESPCPKCGAEDSQSPAWPESRVRGDTYTPYHGHGVWGERANSSMSRQAQYNFQYRRR